MPGRDSDSAINAAIVSRYTSGENTIRLSMDYGLSKSQVNRILKEAGIRRRRRVTLETLPTDTRSHIIRRYHAGYSGREVSYLCGVDLQIVYAVWREEGLNKRVSSRRTEGARKGSSSSTTTSRKSRRLPASRQRADAVELRNALIEEKYLDGVSASIIAGVFGVGRSTVTQVLRGRGIEIRKGRPHKLTDEQQREIAARYSGGESLERLASEFGVTTYTINAVCQRLGQPVRSYHAKRPITPEREAKLVTRYRAGESTESLASAFGVSTKTVLATVRRAGVDVRKPGRPARQIGSEAAADITRRYIAWEPVRSIALDYGIAKDRVIEIAVQGGAARRKVRRAKGTVKRRKPRSDSDS